MSKPRTVHTLESLKSRCVMCGDCWEWKGYVQNNTPQVIAYPDGKKKMVSVRKLIRELIAGQPQPNGHYGHTCGNALCVNPAHTYWRGEKSHMRYMSKKRTYGPTLIKKLRDYRLRSGKVKIDEAKAAEIRNSSDSGPVLAERYGISRSLINRIKRGEVWREVSTPWQGLMK